MSPSPSPEQIPKPRRTSPDDADVFGPAEEKNFSGKLIVAVHGMGDQTRNDFSQTIARLFSRYFVLKAGASSQARLLPLGAWDGGRETPVDDPALQFRTAGIPGSEGLENFAFAEIYWADIARSMENDGYRLEEATHWARSVVERIAHRNPKPQKFGPKQFHLAGFVIEEIAETLALIQKVAMAGKLFTLSKKDVDTVLTQYLCDVQQVGDYQRQREKFRDRFFNRMEKLSESYPDAEIHLIAHSEGTAISFYSLLTALCQKGRDEVDAMRLTKDYDWLAPETKSPGYGEPLTWKWIDQLASFTTMGSPIDKHIHLWPEMWRIFEKDAGGKDAGWFPRPDKPIRWRNYYDYADPVGYELESAVMKLADWDCKAFEFRTKDHDHGFRRYPFPGKAHLDYFTDDGLFNHVIEDAVGYPDDQEEARRQKAKKPGNLPQGWGSPLWPFLIVFALMFAAIYTLDRGLILPDSAPKDLIPLAWQGTTLPDSALTDYVQETWEKFPSARPHWLLGQWALLMGTTVLARILRLTRTLWMWVLALGSFIVGCVLFLLFPGVTGLEAGYRAGGKLLFGECNPAGLLLVASQGMVIGFAALSVGLAWLADWVACLWRWRPVWALRIFILLGTAFVGVTMFLPRLAIKDASALALVSSLAGFAVLWWFGTLIFDLAFCWQRYINGGRGWLDEVREGEATYETTNR